MCGELPPSRRSRAGVRCFNRDVDWVPRERAGRTFVGSPRPSELWRYASVRYRIGLLVIALSMISAAAPGAVGAMIVANNNDHGGVLGWTVLALVGIFVLLLGSGFLITIRGVRRYCEQSKSAIPLTGA
jgi:hypothetical protein